MIATKTDYYLSCLEIERWRLRDAESVASAELVLPAQPQCYVYLLGDKHQPVGLLVAEIRLDNEQEQSLAEAIVKATKQPFISQCVELSQLDEELNAVKVTIALGNVELPDNIPQPVLTTHALADLLGNKSLKAQAWATLKKAMSLMS